MERKEVENLFYEILGRHEYIENEFDLILCGKFSDKTNYFPRSFYNLLYCESVVRMSRILQNGNNFYIFRNLYHTRLEHSKGVYTNALEILLSVYKDEKLKKYIKSHKYEKYCVALLARALLHDMGHGPFSHTMETVCNLPKGFHEDVGERLIREDKQLRDALNKIYPGLPELIFESKEKNFLVLNKLFEGEFDIDRGDYIPRDSAYIYGILDGKRLSYESTSLLNDFYIGNVKNKNNKYILTPIFHSNQMCYIETFLRQRFENYKYIYYHPKSMAYEYIFREFAKVLIERGEECKLKSFFKNNINKKPEDVDLKEYIEFNDIEYLKEIIKVAVTTKDEELRALAVLSLPKPDMADSIYYGLMVSWKSVLDGNTYPRLSSSDKVFLQDLRNMADPDNELFKLINLYKYEENCIVLSSDTYDDVIRIQEEYEKLLGISKDEFERIGLVSWSKYISYYKGKEGEEIYIEASDGNVYEYSCHPNRKNPLESINKHGFFVMVPMLRQAGYKDEDIENIKNVIVDYNKRLSAI